MILTLTTTQPNSKKRFTAYFLDGREISFGLKGGQTYIDHKNLDKKINYWKRHYGNIKERKLIKHLIPSPALLSAMLLWNTDNIDKNIEILNSLWRLKESINQ